MFNTIGLLSAVFITFFGGVFILSASDKEYQNRRFLSFFYFNSAVLFIGHFVAFFKFWEVFRYFDFMFLMALISFYPFYFLFLNKTFHFEITFLKWKKHFIPAAVFGGLMLLATLFTNKAQYTEYMDNNLNGAPLVHWQAKVLAVIYKTSRAFHVLQILYYNFISIRFMLNAKRRITNSYSHFDLASLSQFNIVNTLFLTFMAIPGIFVTIVGRPQIKETPYGLGTLAIVFALLYLLLGIVTLKQSPMQELAEEVESDEGGETAYPDMKCLEKLQRFFEQEKPWLNPKLNIWEVAKELGTNRTYISRCINDNLSYNFNAFVNEYRVKEACSKLGSHQLRGLTLNEIAIACGFGSLSSFNRIFKEVMGKSPTSYRNENG